MAQFFHRTQVASRFPGLTGFSPKVDQVQREVTPGAFWHLFHEVKLDLDRIVVTREIETLGNPGYVSIDNNPGDVESSSQYHVGCFSAHTREFNESLKCSWHRSMVPLDQRRGTILNVLGLVAVITGGSDEPFDQRFGGFRKSLGCRQLIKKRSGDLVYLFVGALCR